MADQDTTGAPTGEDAASSVTEPKEFGVPPSERENFTPLEVKPLTGRVPQPSNVSDDIANILKEVKLPERPAPEPTKQTENRAAALEAAPPAPESVAEHEVKAPDIVAPVHTLKDDLQFVVQDQKISRVRAVAIEEEKRAHTGASAEAQEPRRTRTKRILFSAVVLFLLGAAALAAVSIYSGQRTAPQQAQLPVSSILFAESTAPFSLSGQSSDDLKRALASARASTQGTLGSIEEIVPTVSTTSSGAIATRPATFSEFMSAIGAQPPSELLRALSDNFFFGIHTVDKEAPLIVVPVASYDHAFAGMLAWEATLNADLAPIFTLVPATATDQNGLPVARTFTDMPMHNHDTRALLDDGGQVELYYSFPTQNLLVIAESPYSFAEILSRLQAARQL